MLIHETVPASRGYPPFRSCSRFKAEAAEPIPTKPDDRRDSPLPWTRRTVRVHNLLIYILSSPGITTDAEDLFAFRPVPTAVGL